jgi:hypothetical protein
MAKRWWSTAAKCPWCSGRLGIFNVKLTVKNRFRCPLCRNSLRLHVLPLLAVVALVWAAVDVPLILYAWEPQATASTWFVALSCVLDAFVFFALLAPLFVRALPNNRNAA